MSYQSRIREIMSAFTLGHQSREASISLFEMLMHEYGLLPQGGQLDRTITNENFLALLRVAREHRVSEKDAPVPVSDLEKHVDLRKAEEDLRKFTRWMEQVSRTNDQRYRIADDVKRRCPVCQQAADRLYNRVRSMDQEEIPVDPPRCRPCMTKWVRERYGVTIGDEPEQPRPSTADGTPVTPLRSDEKDFFAEYERQMGEKE